MLSLRTCRWFPAGATFNDEPFVLADGTNAVPFLAGAAGLLSPGYSVITSELPGVRGSRFGSAVAKPNVVAVPILVEGDTYAALRRKRSELIEALVPGRGPGMLELSADLSTDAGESRWCPAVYAGGLEGDESLSISGPTWWRPVLRFQPLDLWYSTEPVTARWAGRVGNNFFPFSFPFTLAPYGLDVLTPLDLGGNAESWPSFTLTGPFTRVRFTNVRTSEWWEVLRSNDERNVPLVVSTKPGEVAVRTAAGVNAYGLRTAGSQFFALSPGDLVNVVADGVSGATRFDLTVWPAWLTAP